MSAIDVARSAERRILQDRSRAEQPASIALRGYKVCSHTDEPLRLCLAPLSAAHVPSLECARDVLHGGAAREEAN